MHCIMILITHNPYYTIYITGTSPVEHDLNIKGKIYIIIMTFLNQILNLCLTFFSG